MSNQTSIRFNTTSRQFYTELKKRVDSYFKENKLSKSGNLNMYLKTAFMFGCYFGFYGLIVGHVFESKLIWLLLAALMGVSFAGIGLCVMHDANHGSYSKNQTVNRLLGIFSMNVIGGYAINWRIQHNVLHHTYTNIHEHDEDIAPPGMLRFEPHAQLKGVHKLQFIYAWFLYGIMTLMWSTTKDFRQLKRYNDLGLLKGVNAEFRKEVFFLIFSKLFYYAYMLLPLFLIPEMTVLNWICGFLIMHYMAGLVLALIFQPAHVVEETEFPLPDENGNLENHWAVHQLHTTMNFATRDPIFTWLVGGLNFQVEHHLFPTICHVHYPQISKIVESTAREFNLPYKKQSTFVSALWSHQCMLWRLGRA